MTFEACAGIVERGDPDRFLATMAARPEARRVLFPIYAFLHEVSRAPWVTQEPMIAQMRLQWWRDALEEIAAGGPVRTHEVTTPLAGVLDAEAAKALDRTVAAREWDIEKKAFKDQAAFVSYLDATAAEPMWQAARLLGAEPEREQQIRSFGYATGLARYLMAVPELEARGRIPLVDGRSKAVAELAKSGLAVASRPNLHGMADAASLEGWMTKPTLKRAASDPSRVAQGALAVSPFRKKIRLLRWSH